MEPPVAGSLIPDILLFLTSLSFCALFSFIETSITAVRLFKLKEIARGTKKYSALLSTLEHNPSKVLITILVAYNLSNVIAAVLSSYLMEKLTRALSLSDTLGFTVGILITSTTILVADLIPKNLATTSGDRLFKSTLWITNFLFYALHPFVTFLSRFTDGATRMINRRFSEADENMGITSEKEIRFLIDYIYEKGLIESHKTAMLKNIFELSSKPVKDIMVPEIDIISISADNNQKTIQEVFAQYQFTRLPVYDGTPENIIGMLHQKDFFGLLSKKEDKPLRDIVRPIMFIPESAKLLRILREFREQRMHIAIVLNEFGGISGLVTLEDIIEEIVGEISDEYEPTREKIIALKSGDLLVDASIELKELAQTLKIEFEVEDALTLAGFLIEQFQHVPKPGEILDYKGFHFQIQQSSPKRIYQVLIYKNQPLPAT